MIHRFKYYLHDSYTSRELREYLETKLGVTISEELMQKIGRPFYEVELQCQLDDSTGEVKILGVTTT